MANSCDECYEMRQPHTMKCPDCGKNTYVGQVVGICSEWKCSSCGSGIVSAGGFPPACWCNEEYELSIEKPNDSKSMVKLAKILNRNVIELNKSFSDNSKLTISLNLLDCVKTFKTITALGITAKIDSLLLNNFSRIMDCRYIER